MVCSLIRSALKSDSHLNSLSYDLEMICGVGAQLKKTVQFTRANARQKDSKDEKTEKRNRNVQMRHVKSTSQVFSQF